ncbi:DUF998 domain-containing protein [Actinospica sp. MGRD01-02]|uniref:DUF998 domain-containing protein n=1 Tax=Actinospica acidithermotolerans TaxID=2828514 RepID=A0A941E7S6_9ACTN|nr:hypothetical protein [Actinospica acidithermotolerans]MBR7827900.1 DUF998 domain-containing protein [Actinospica acidithermotolerans]
MELAVSYLFLRRAIGLIGALLPIALPIGYSITTGRWVLLSSVSSYYNTDMRNVFVGALCAIGVFLICYRYQYWDDVFATLAGAFAIGVAFCPPLPPNPSELARVTGTLHIVFAACFLVSMALMSLLLFTRSDLPPAERTSAKKARNVIYQLCGTLMLAFTALGGLSSLASQSFVDKVHPLFWCEALATFAFGFAWWVKGETLWRDAEAPSPLAAAGAAAAHG